MVVSKQLLHPLLGLGLLLGAKQVGVLPPSVDALQLLVMALVWSTPSAVMVHSLATMMQVREGRGGGGGGRGPLTKGMP
jgi:hypothetical protein